MHATDSVLKSGRFVDGPYAEEFEDWLCKRTGCRYAITVHSGTQALEMIARHELNEFYPRTEITPTIIIPNITYPATINAFINAGWDIEICDTDRNGLMISNTSNRPYAYECHVGLYGAPINKSYSGVIVDGAQHWLVAGDNIGNAMAISFDPTKNLPATGNGGAIVTNDIEVYKFVYDFKNNGKTEHSIAGTNSKMSEQECAQILVRTKYLDQWQRRREEIKKYYIDRFKGLPIRCLSEDFSYHANHKFVIYSSDRNELKDHLMSEGIEVKIHYEKPLSFLPIAATFKKPDLLSVSVMLCKGTLSLPIYPELTDTEVEYISEKVIQFFDK